jgi:hypothetical protein
MDVPLLSALAAAVGGIGRLALLLSSSTLPVGDSGKGLPDIT